MLRERPLFVGMKYCKITRKTEKRLDELNQEYTRRKEQTVKNMFLLLLVLISGSENRYNIMVMVN